MLTMLQHSQAMAVAHLCGCVHVKRPDPWPQVPWADTAAKLTDLWLNFGVMQAVNKLRAAPRRHVTVILMRL